MASAGTTSRPPLSREAIVTTAIRLIETEGESAASMRRISAELGVAAMSLYNHVPNKAALLDAVGDQIRAQIHLPDDPGLDWEARARLLGRAFHDVVSRYPRSTELMMARAPSSLVGLEPLEYALDMCEQAGFKGRDALAVVRAFVAYVVGATTQAAVRARAAQALAAGAQGPDPALAAKFPRVAALGPDMFAADTDDFEFGLDLLIRAVTQLRRD